MQFHDEIVALQERVKVLEEAVFGSDAPVQTKAEKKAAEKAANKVAALQTSEKVAS